MNKTYILAAAAGAIVGAVASGIATYFVFKKKFDEELDARTESVKKAYKGALSDYIHDKNDREEEKILNFTNPHPEIKKTYETLAGNYDTEIGKASAHQRVDYATISQRPVDEGVPEDHPDVPEDLDPTDPARPYVISPEEFAEDEDCTKIEVFLFNDGHLADDFGDPLEEVGKVVPLDELEKFKNDPDTHELFTKSDARECMYTITKMDYTWEEYLAEHQFLKETSL